MKSEGRVEQKSKFILLATSVAACFVLYWVWHNLRDPFDDSPGDSKCQWRKRNCLTVPKIIREASPKIANKTVEIKLGAQTLLIAYKLATPEENVQVKKKAVVLFTGLPFTSREWERRRTIHMIAATGYYVYAVDLPGLGESTLITVDDKSGFLLKLFQTLNIDRPIIISPSTAGMFTLPYLFGDNEGQDGCESKASGFIPVAPIGAYNFADVKYRQCKIPTMIVHCSLDNGIEVPSVQSLQHLPNSAIMAIETEKYPCYKFGDSVWQQMLYNYLLTVVT